LGEALKDIEQSSSPLEQITTGNLDALREFGSAVRAIGERRLDVAQAHLERALQLDPEFAMAHAHMGLLSITLQRDTAAGQTSLQRAADLSERLSRRERLQINAAQHHYADTAGALERTMALAAEYPDHAAARHNLGLILAFWRLQPEQALPHFEHVMASGHPRRAESFLTAALSQLMLGRLEQAQATIAQARLLGGVAPMRQEGLIDLAAGDHATVQEVLDRANAVAAQRNQVEFALLHAALLLQQGKVNEALQRVQQRIAEFGEASWSAPAVLLRVNALALQGKLGQLNEPALREVLEREGARLADPEQLADRSPELHLAMLAVVAQRGGFDGVAQEALVRLRPSLAARNQHAISAMAASVDCLLQPPQRRLPCLDDIATPHYAVTLGAAWQSAAVLSDAEQSAERRDRLLAARLQAYAEAPFLEWLLLNLMALQDAAG
jgi:tetratricopeptide (TPR) repeat protein